MRHLVRAAIFVVLGLLGLLAPAPLSAHAAAPPVLRGTALTSTDVEIFNAQCDAAGTSSFEFSTSGVAVSSGSIVEPVAYLGTFTESGSVTIGPGVAPYGFGQLLSFDASFTITSGSTVITGTKHLTSPVPFSSSSDGRCLDLPSEFFPYLVSGRLTLAQNTTTLWRYTATISTAAGSYIDRGYSRGGVLRNDYCDSFGNCSGEAGFNEDFISDYQSPVPAVGPPATLTLTPVAATNVVGTQHCVTATAQDALANPTPGVTIRFATSGSVTTSGAQTTNASGQATYCYQGPELPGANTIGAFADTDADGAPDVGEPVATAAKTWALPLSTPLCSVQINDGGRITTSNGDKATFGGNAQVSGSSATKGQQNYRDHGPVVRIIVKSTKVLAVICTPDRKQASIYGTATINGAGSFNFKIDVRDIAEPGVGKDTYRILLSSGYDSAERVLQAGNVQIR